MFSLRERIADRIRGAFHKPLRGEILDVSHHQGDIDWGQVIESGVGATYIKATEGVDHVDTRLRRNLSWANQSITHGVYHFGTWYNADPVRPEVDARAEAEHFVKTAERYHPHIWDHGHLTPMLDVELVSGGRGKQMTYSAITAWMHAFGWRVDGLTGRVSGVYTGRYFIFGDPVTKTRGIGPENVPQFARRPLWLAQYNGGHAPKKPIDGWRTQLWQYTGSGSCPGVKGKVDRNAWLGSTGDYLRLCGFEHSASESVGEFVDKV